MELKDFIKETIVQIFEGVQSAQPVAKELGGTVNPFDRDYTDTNGNLAYSEYSEKRFIDFEVSLTKANNSETGSEIGGKIAVYFGEISIGRKGKIVESDISFNKVKFSVPVFYPVNKIR